MCVVCNKAIDISSMGEAALQSHTIGKNHKKLMELKLSSSVTHFLSSSLENLRYHGRWIDSVCKLHSYAGALTEYRFKIARHNVLQYGRGAKVSMMKSPRLCIELTQVDHVESPHVTQDLPFGQRHLRLSSGQALETPNVNAL